ncbi:hypothetical protein CPB86DRAFT_52207 [Serendipita vermifera]|nr:hypothetical protein CPB86DRAFT_52207 [Serendipita vermifera]
MQSQAQFNDLRFATEYPSLIALPQIIATCTQAGLPSSLVTSLRRLQTCLKNAATTIAFYVAPAQGPVLDQLINGIPVKSFIQELIQSLGEPNKYLTTATVTRSQQQLSITMGGKTFQQDITSVDEVSEALEQIQGFEQSIRRALDRLHTILSKLPPSDSVDTQHAQVETAINVAIAALDIAFDRAPFRINKGVITAAALTLPHNRLNVDLSILNHPSFAILSAGTAIPGFGFYSLNAKGEEWALTQMKHRGPWPVLDELLNCYKPSSDVSIIANEEPWDRLRGSLGRSIASFNSTSRSRFNEVARSKVRIVVCGGLSSGKSTMLNALIGKELLITSERASTAWPILVKHDPTQMEPILEMNPDHFKPFLAALSTISETEFWNKVESLDRKLMPHLSDLRTAGFSFSPQPVLGYDAIRTVLLQINALIRGCYSCSLPVERPRLLNDNWPKITISMEQFRSHPYSIEFIDLPGFNDGIIPKADLMMLLETAFQSSEGGLLVFKAASSTIDSAAFHMYAQHILHSRQGKPLIAVGTGADEHIYNPRLWDREALGAIRSILRIRNGSDDSGGVVVCSPEWFWSANVTIEEVRKLNKVPSLEKLRQTDAEMALDLWWPQGKDLMDYWQTLTPQNIVSIMEEEAKKSQFHLVSQCVEGRLIKDALHQHRTLATEAISNEAMSLCNQYQ